MKILETVEIGGLVLRNRMKFASTTTCFCTEEGRATDQEAKWLEERAKGGVGLVTTGMAHVTSWGRLNPRVLGGWDDSFIKDFRDLAGAIHSGGAKACLSMVHCGRYAYREDELVDASSVRTRVMTRAEPRQLSGAEIDELVQAFAETARRAKEAGFDAVEVCGCAGYLLSSFLSPWTNRRTDQYGGSLRNRARFSLEVVERIKARAGDSFPVIFRICGDEQMPEGNTPADLTEVARMLEEAGVDALSLTVGWHESTVPAITGEIPPGHWLYLAEGIKKNVKIPVMMAYRVGSAEAEKALGEGIIDLWEASRPFIADPEIPKKWAENRPEDIVPCICCCQRCYDHVFRGVPIGCVVNPRAGREGDRQYEIKPAQERKRVAVLGGGPAGMQAAVLAAVRGHDVVLLEKEKDLGGNLAAAGVPPFKSDFESLNRYLVGQLEKCGVTVKRNQEAAVLSPEVAEAEAVIMATGASPLLPDIPGIDRDNVLTAVDVLMKKRAPGKKIVVIGGGLVGCETAEFLAKEGREVKVLEVLDKIAGDMGPTLRWRLLSRLKTAGVEVVTGVQVKGVGEGGVQALVKGEERSFQADQVVIAVGMKANVGLAQELKAKAPSFQQVGDAVKPRKMGEAMEEGFLAANRI